MHFCDVIGPKCYLIKCSRRNKCIIFKKKQKYQVKSVFTKFHLTNIKGMRADRCSSLVFLFYGSACTMHGSIIRHDPIPEKTIMVVMILTLCLALYISYPNFKLFMLMILWLIITCKGTIKISKAPLILGYMHVLKLDIRLCPI